MVRKLLAAAAFAAVVSTPALASDTAVRTFVRDGVTYSYQTTQKDGVTVLQGTADNSDFRLEVRGDKVTGIANGTRVAFKVPAIKAETASR
jgi:hypothetical protein